MLDLSRFVLIVPVKGLLICPKLLEAVFRQNPELKA